MFELVCFAYAHAVPKREKLRTFDRRKMYLIDITTDKTIGSYNKDGLRLY